MCTEIATDHGRWICCAVALTRAESEAKEAGHLTGFPSRYKLQCPLLQLRRINS